MEKRNEIASAKSSLKSNIQNDELSLEDVLGEQASELPERPLMHHHGHHSYYHYDYCYYPCYYYYPCYSSYGS